MLGIMFTVLPLQTSAVVAALSARSPHQRGRYRPSGDGAHVLVAAPSGLTGEAAESVAAALLDPSRLDQALPPAGAPASSSSSSSSCVAYARVVFLCPHPPDARTRALLKSPPNAARLTFLQGSCLRPADLSRAAAGAAAAILLLADERAADPRSHDLAQAASLMALGHALHARDRREARAAGRHARRYAGLAAVVVAGAAGPTSGGARALGLGLLRRLALAAAAQLLRLTLALQRLRDWALLRPERPHVKAARRARLAAVRAARAARAEEAEELGKRSGSGAAGERAAAAAAAAASSATGASSPAAAAAASVMAAAAAAALRPPRPPRVLVQLALPESRHYVELMLREMRGGAAAAAVAGAAAASTTAAAGDLGGGSSLAPPPPPPPPLSRSGTCDSGAGRATPQRLTSGGGGGGGLERFVERASAAVLRQARSGGGGGGARAAADEAGDGRDPECPPAARRRAPSRATRSVRALLRLGPVAPFWRRFGASVSLVCAAELSAAMLAVSAAPSAAPGAAALLANLVRPLGGPAAEPGGGAAAAASTTPARSFAGRYLLGARSGLHCVRRLPRHLRGQPFARVATYAHAAFGLAIVALVERRRRPRGGRQGKEEEDDDEEEGDDDANGSDNNDDDSSGQSEDDEGGESDDDDDDDEEEEEEPALVLAPPPPRRARVRRRDGALVIAPDAYAAAALGAAPRAHYEAWWRAQQQQQQQQQHRQQRQIGCGRDDNKDGGQIHAAAASAAAAAHLPVPPPPPPAPAPAAAAAASPPVLASARHLSGHLLVCGGDGTRASVLLSAVLPLRAAAAAAAASAPAPPVVLLDRRPAPPDVDDDPDGAAAWARLAALGGVFFVQGTAAHLDDLRRAGAEAAAGAIVLCRASPRASAASCWAGTGRDEDDGAGDGSGTGSVEARVLDDAEALRRARLVRSLLRPPARVCVELWLATSCLGLGGMDSLAAAEAAMGGFSGAGGRRARAGSAAPDDDELLLRAATTAEFMGGGVALSAGFGLALLSQGLQSREGAAFLRRLLLPTADAPDAAAAPRRLAAPGGGVVALELRDVDPSRTPAYGGLFAELARAELVPLGLRRRATAPGAGSDWSRPRRWAEQAAAMALGLGARGEEGDEGAVPPPRSASSHPRHPPRAPLCYVQTNPAADERLERGDRVLVLVRRPAAGG